jgi:glycosyltransferase involved in cell wall biosynthesis
MSSSAIPLTAVILCRNEAVNLERCINALRGVGEIVVVDDGSTDGSLELAQSLGARVVENRFVSFADQRNWTMDHANLSYDWVLHLDADEVMTPDALDEIRRALPSLRSQQTGFVARKIMLDGRWLRFSADYPVYVPRLIHRHGTRFVMRGHGEIIETTEGKSVFFKEPLLHHVFSKGWPDWWERHQRYARAEAARIAGGLPVFSLCQLRSKDSAIRRGALRALSYRLPGRPALRFLYAYVLKLGFLDGRPGFDFCCAMAQYERMINRELKALKVANRL